MKKKDEGGSKHWGERKGEVVKSVFQRVERKKEGPVGPQPRERRAKKKKRKEKDWKTPPTQA